MKKLKIGIFSKAEILNTIRENQGIEAIEGHGRDPKFSFNKNILDIVKKESKGIDLSIHSQTKKIFTYSDDKDFTLGEMITLKIEILICNIVGAKELIFHVKDEKLNKEEEKIFKEIVDFAEKRNVDLVYEINGEFVADACLDFLSRFPKVNLNLDLGHLNFAVGTKTINMDMEEFIKKIKDRVVYIHAHNNNGLKDEHKSLDEGTLDWKYVLDMLNLKKIKKIIIEVNEKDGELKTKKLLEDYIKRRG